VFSDIKGIIHYEFVQPELSGKKISLQVLEQLQQHIRKKKIYGIFFQTSGFLILTTPLHTTFSVTMFLNKKLTALMEYPPHSSDLAICDFLMLNKNFSLHCFILKHLKTFRAM